MHQTAPKPPRVAKNAKSGKLVVLGLFVFVALAVFGAWLGQRAIEAAKQPTVDKGAPSVLSEGVLYEAKPGDPATVSARNVGSGETLWNTELGTIPSQPLLLMDGELLEVRVAGTPWMHLNRFSGAAVER